MASRFGLQIRVATAADAAGIAELTSAAGLSASTPAWARRVEALGRENGILLLALEWGPPSGLIALHWNHTLLADHPIAQVETLLVGPSERRRGIGRLLLKAGAQAARAAGCDSLQLLTQDSDPTLPAFASASGFDRSGTVLARGLRKASR